MDADSILREQDWEAISARLTALAYNQLREKSWHRAEDLAQEAIARAFEAGHRSSHYKPWDPTRQPLINYLISRVIYQIRDEMRSRRNACEVALDYEAELVASDAALADELLDRRGFAVRFSDTLFAYLTEDPVARRIAELMADGVVTQGELAQETGHSIAEIKAARKRLFRLADRVTQEISPPPIRARRGEPVQ
jgi:DNA-directed RNA polymerase specialized sigma24 family protein